MPTAIGEKQGDVTLGAFCICGEGCGAWGVYGSVNDALVVVKPTEQDWRQVAPRMKVLLAQVLLPALISEKMRFRYRRGKR